MRKVRGYTDAIPPAVLTFRTADKGAGDVPDFLRPRHTANCMLSASWMSNRARASAPCAFRDGNRALRPGPLCFSRLASLRVRENMAGAWNAAFLHTEGILQFAMSEIALAILSMNCHRFGTSGIANCDNVTSGLTKCETVVALYISGS